MVSFAAAALALVAAGSCTPARSAAKVEASPRATAHPPADTAASQAPGTPEESPGEPLVWKPVTSSPRGGGASDPNDRELLAACPAGDDALGAAALRVARRQARGLPALDMGEVSFALRAEGSPYVWPRAWTIEGATLENGHVRERLERWLETFDDGGQRRCGISSVRQAGPRQVVAAVAVDALADLAPIPTRARSGEWIDVDAKLLVPASEAKVIVLGPLGPPRTVISSLSAGRVRARFSADRAGPWLVQVVASVRVGPRPVAEAMLHVDEEPATSFHARPAPGEEAADDAPDELSAIERMVNRARASERLGALRRDEHLDRIAQAHADAMHAARRVGHDIGLGDTRARVEAAGLDINSSGENASHAANVRRAHRALWASPSHRGNLLLPRFDRIGVGVAHDSDGSVWVCEVLADFR